MWRVFCYHWSHGTYPDYFCHVLPAGPYQLPLATMQVETWRQNTCPNHLGRVQGIPLTQLGWLTSLCEHLLGKAQERLPALAEKSPRLSSPPEALARGLPRVWSCCNSKRGDYDSMLLGKPETFCPGLVGCPRPWPELLGRGRGESRQCGGKGDAPILFQYP